MRFVLDSTEKFMRFRLTPLCHTRRRAQVSSDKLFNVLALAAQKELSMLAPVSFRVGIPAAFAPFLLFRHVRHGSDAERPNRPTF